MAEEGHFEFREQGQSSGWTWPEGLGSGLEVYIVRTLRNSMPSKDKIATLIKVSCELYFFQHI